MIAVLFQSWFLIFCSVTWAAQPQPEKTPVVPEPEKKIESVITDDLFKIRDPFKMPELEVVKASPKSDLERFPVDAYKLVGVLTGPEKLRALVLAPDGKTYFVSENAKIGVRGGFVRKITPDAIKVREKFVNMIGREENIESDIRMPAEGRAGNKDSAVATPGGPGRSSGVVR